MNNKLDVFGRSSRENAVSKVKDMATTAIDPLQDVSSFSCDDVFIPQEDGGI